MTTQTEMIKKQQTMHKGGRPRKTKDERRLFSHKISYTATEEETVRFKAEQNDQTLKAYLHYAPLDTKVMVRETDLERDLKRELSAIGNNINQIAHQANIGNLLSLSDRCRELLLLLKTVLLHFLTEKGIMIPKGVTVQNNIISQQNRQQNGC